MVIKFLYKIYSLKKEGSHCDFRELFLLMGFWGGKDGDLGYLYEEQAENWKDYYERNATW
jgi:hypothetical protein